MGGTSVAGLWARIRAWTWDTRWSEDWRIASVNGLLLAGYLVPTWTAAAFKLYLDPVRGLFDRANVAPALFAGDTLHLASGGMVRFALLLALVKITVAIFFASFVSLSIIAGETEREDCDELLHIGLVLAALVSVGSMALAYSYGEADALRLHATETLMIVAAAVVAVIDEPRRSADTAVPAQLAEAHN